MENKSSSRQDGSSSTSGSLPVVPDQDETIARLRDENARLRAELAQLHRQTESSDDVWQTEMDRGIVYADGASAHSAKAAKRTLAQLTGLSEARMKAGRIPQSSDFDYLPRPSTDQAQLEADFIRWGYCLVKDAMSPDQVQAQLDRLIEQAETERQLNVAVMAGVNNSHQRIDNVVLKGDVFRDAVALEESAARKGPLVDRLLTKILGEGFGLACAHGSVIFQGGGLQELHIDQSAVPSPYPPFPFGSLIIWCFTDFTLADGSTYIVPGSHRSASGATRFHDGLDLMKLVDNEPGLVAICAPAGTCVLTDTRVLHCGGRRTAPGTRYALRCHYNLPWLRPIHEQSKVNLHVPDDVYQLISPRLKQMMGITNNETPVGELSQTDS